MTENGRWKMILKYMVGILALAASLALAILAPDWYSEWQDSRSLNQVTLSSRESIEFLDVDSLDVAGRLQMLQEAESFTWSRPNYLIAPEPDTEAVIGRCSSQVELWCEQGLLPSESTDWIKQWEKTFYILDKYVVYVNQTMLPVWVMRFISSDGANTLMLVMDDETDMIYYASASGKIAMEDMAQAMGCHSLLELQELLQEGETAFPTDPAVPHLGFDTVCGARTASISGEGSWLELSAELDFPAFTGQARREVISSDFGFGMTVIYGTSAWMDLVAEVNVEYGFYEYLESESSWMEYLINDTEAFSVAEAPYYYDAVYGAAAEQ